MWPRRCTALCIQFASVQGKGGGKGGNYRAGDEERCAAAFRRDTERDRSNENPSPKRLLLFSHAAVTPHHQHARGERPSASLPLNAGNPPHDENGELVYSPLISKSRVCDLSAYSQIIQPFLFFVAGFFSSLLCPAFPYVLKKKIRIK